MASPFSLSNDSRQLEVIDQIRELGVGDDISLPMIVVAGDQSSGKSSLLEGLTNLAFPVASQLCTRYATQVSFRRSAGTEDTVRISITPSAGAEDGYKAKIAKFGRTLERFNPEAFSDVLEEAAICMGLADSKDKETLAWRRFSPDELKIEISGPTQPHLSIVDIPGLFHSPTPEQTVEDKKVIRDLILKYIRDPRTIIIAVLNSLNNLANQEVFRLAKDADPDGSRTIGVMTKLDALQGGDEAAALRIAQNKFEVLKLGWYCVRNRSTEEINKGVTISERHAEERAFFSRQPWSNLSKKRTGIVSLKKSLGELLTQHISHEFEAIRGEIDAKHEQKAEELKELGPARNTPQEQMQYLTRMATMYQRLADDALIGRRSSPSSSTHSLKRTLRTQIEARGDYFNQIMFAQGQTYHFKKATEKFVPAPEGNEIQEPEDDSTSAEVKGGSESEDEAASAVGDRDIYRMISEKWQNTRGIELAGHVNPATFEELFFELTPNWERCSKEHVDKIIDIISACNERLFQTVCKDVTIRARIQKRIDPAVKGAHKVAKEALVALLSLERSGHLLTSNHYFAENLYAARTDRLVQRLKGMGLTQGSQLVLDLKRLNSGVHLSNHESAVYDIHDTLQAYYKVAIKRFIDNVKTQVIEHHLLGPNGPISIFTPDWVATLDAEELVAICGKDCVTTNQRAELKMQLERLEKAKKICAGKGV